MAVEITKENFEKEVTSSDKPVVMDFWAEWCGPCKMSAPAVEELSKSMANVKFVKINVEQNPEIAQQFSVHGIPTFVVLKNGKEEGRFSGFTSKNALEKNIQEFI